MAIIPARWRPGWPAPTRLSISIRRCRFRSGAFSGGHGAHEDGRGPTCLRAAPKNSTPHSFGGQPTGIAATATITSPGSRDSPAGQSGSTGLPRSSDFSPISPPDLSASQLSPSFDGLRMTKDADAGRRGGDDTFRGGTGFRVLVDASPGMTGCQAFSACSRSAIRSSGCSRPIDRRTRLSPTPISARCSGLKRWCVVVAG